MNQFKNRKVPIIKGLNMVLFLVVVSNLFGQVQPIKLTQLLDSALANNYSLKLAEKNKLIKQSEIEILKTNYLPRVSTSASFSYCKFLLPNKERLLGGNLTDMYTDITLYQTIYDWGENKVKKSVVEDEIILNDKVRRQIRNTIIWGVSDAYFPVDRLRIYLTTTSV